MAEIAWIKIHGQDKYKRLAKALREAGRGDLQRKLTREIRRQGDPALTAVKAAWLGIDVTPPAGDAGKSTGLRQRVSNATRISILGNGIRIRVESKRVDPRYPSLPYYLNGLGRKPWRHPVFGNTEVWKTQYGKEVFFKTLEGYEDKWRAGIEKAMEATAREISG